MLIGTLILLGIIMTIVTLHEAGHLVMAKRYGVKVPVFSVGFGPRLIGFKFYKGSPDHFGRRMAYKILNFKPSNECVWNRGETEYRLAPIPFGGFCAMEGEINGTTEDALSEKPFYQKFLIIAGGIIVNFITGFLAIIGVAINKLGFLQGLKTTVAAIKNMIEGTYIQIVNLIQGTVPLARWEEITEASASMSSIEGIILQFGFYSIILGLFNALPIPALDGSYPFLWGLEYIFGKRIGRVIANFLIMLGFTILMGLQLFIIYYWIFI